MFDLLPEPRPALAFPRNIWCSAATRCVLTTKVTHIIWFSASWSKRWDSEQTMCEACLRGTTMKCLEFFPRPDSDVVSDILGPGNHSH